MAQTETLRFIITALPTILQNTTVILLIERVLPISRDFTYKFETFFIYKVCVWYCTCTLFNYSSILAYIFTLLLLLILLNKCVLITKNV